MPLQLDELPKSTRTRKRAPSLFRPWLEHPRLPARLALGAVLAGWPFCFVDLPIYMAFSRQMERMTFEKNHHISFRAWLP